MYNGEPEIDSLPKKPSTSLNPVLNRRMLVRELVSLGFLGGLGHALASYPSTLERFPHRFTSHSLKSFLAMRLGCETEGLRLEVMINPDRDNPCTICIFQNPAGDRDCQVFFYHTPTTIETFTDGNMEINNEKFLIDGEDRDAFIEYARTLPRKMDFNKR